MLQRLAVAGGRRLAQPTAWRSLALRQSRLSMAMMSTNLPDPASAKEHVVVLGSGWAGYEAARKLDKSLFDVTLVSPANHKVRAWVCVCLPLCATVVVHAPASPSHLTHVHF
jgi:ribulose 1,5-bisphosphate synthetase/thiazole synthase